MPTVEGLINKHFNVADGVLQIGSVSVADLVMHIGTPCFVYDAAIMDKKLALLRRVLPSTFKVYYSVKANPNPAIIKRFVSRGCGLEIASAGEFVLGVKAGCSNEKIIFAGPGKTDAELELVLAKGIGEIHVESLSECERIARICRKLGGKANVSLRINPTAEVQGGAMRMGGKPSPFGIDEESITDVLNQLLTIQDINVRGVHLFTGTQILDHQVLLNQYRKGLQIAGQVAAQLGGSVQTVDFGGGLGIPYFGHEEELNVEELREGLLALMEEAERLRCFRGTEFIVEPGRYLVGESGVYLARVTDVKTSRGKTFVILDGGLHHHLAASGNLGQTIKRNYPIALVNRLSGTRHAVVDVVGPLCTPLDTLGRNVELPLPEIGDLVGIFQSGAYGLTASPIAFLSHPVPAEVLIEDCQLKLIRERTQFGPSESIWE